MPLGRLFAAARPLHFTSFVTTWWPRDPTRLHSEQLELQRLRRLPVPALPHGAPLLGGAVSRRPRPYSWDAASLARCWFCAERAQEHAWQARRLVPTCAEHSLRLFGPAAYTLPLLHKENP